MAWDSNPSVTVGNATKKTDIQTIIDNINFQKNSSDGSLLTTLQALFASGSVGAPTIAPSGDPNTGIFFETGILHLVTAGAKALSVNADGAVTKPLQPAFLTYLGSDQLNIPINTLTSISFNNTAFDQSNNFSNPVFTAPVTGQYHLNLNLYLSNIDNASTLIQIYLVTSNRSYRYLLKPDVYYSIDTLAAVSFSVLADMDMNDVVTPKIYITGGTAQTDIVGFSDNGSYFSGFLVA